MANVLNRTTKEYLTSVNTPDFDVSLWVINPDLSAVIGFASKYWIITGDVVTLQNQAQRDITDDTEFQTFLAAAATESELFGDGNDGDIVISANQPLTQDIYPQTLTVNAGITLDTAGFRIIARKGVVNLGVIRNNGANAVGATAGAGGVSGTIGGGGAGATGTNAAGANATGLNVDATPGTGGKGGDGGAGSSGAGGNGGNVRSGTTSRVRSRRLDTLISQMDLDVSVAGNIARFQGGAGGGAGSGGGGANLGGGGGGGGGILVIIAPSIFLGLGATLEARGGNGGNATGGNSGGGGSGGGGVIATAAISFRERGARNVSPGTPGNPTGTGVIGSTGNSGRTIHLPIH